MPAGSRFNVAFVGQKGIPATFGGDRVPRPNELSRRLALRGHQVTVYVRSWYTKPGLDIYEGVRLVHTPTLRTKHLDATLHSLTSSLHALTQPSTWSTIYALGPSFFAWLPKLRGKRVVVTVHALDWQYVPSGARSPRPS